MLITHPIAQVIQYLKLKSNNVLCYSTNNVRLFKPKIKSRKPECQILRFLKMPKPRFLEPFYIPGFSPTTDVQILHNATTQSVTSTRYKPQNDLFLLRTALKFPSETTNLS